MLTGGFDKCETLAVGWEYIPCCVVIKQIGYRSQKPSSKVGVCIERLDDTQDPVIFMETSLNVKKNEVSTP